MSRLQLSSHAPPPIRHCHLLVLLHYRQYTGTLSATLSASRALLAASIMARQKGASNYQNRILINIIAEMLPNGSYAWTAVANAYHEASKEATVREGSDVKNHWVRKLCNSMKKPTGRTGEDADRIQECRVTGPVVWL